MKKLYTLLFVIIVYGTTSPMAQDKEKAEMSARKGLFAGLVKMQLLEREKSTFRKKPSIDITLRQASNQCRHFTIFFERANPTSSSTKLKYIFSGLKLEPFIHDLQVIQEMFSQKDQDFQQTIRSTEHQLRIPKFTIPLLYTAIGTKELKSEKIAWIIGLKTKNVQKKFHRHLHKFLITKFDKNTQLAPTMSKEHVARIIGILQSIQTTDNEKSSSGINDNELCYLALTEVDKTECKILEMDQVD